MNNINKSYHMGNEELKALVDVNFTVEEGEYVAILGPSGSGKSTLMNILGCMDRTTSGEYFLDGEAVHQMNDRQLTNVRNKKIGFIFQRYHLISQYDVLQNIIMPLLTRGISHKKAREMAGETIELIGLSERLLHKPRELSGGQQQRVAIARALVGNPALLLADEPTGALDSKTSQDVLALFGRLNQMGRTVIMITHDLSVAQNARRIVRIIDGRLYHDGESPLQEK